MGWSYKRLWILLIEKDLSRGDIKKLAHISPNAMAQLSKSQPVTLEALGRICAALNCRLEDIVEYVPDSPAASDAADDV